MTGYGYMGSPAVLTSTANQEVIPLAPTHWSDDRYTLYKFSFINYTDCTVKINNGEPIFLKAEQGFECDRYDAEITSFIIVNTGIKYSWLGSY
ncbi:hypothetical protein [Psychrobacillus phage Perkons]|nr:hypothetical protein [Psychrobacillus phage Perkons]